MGEVSKGEGRTVLFVSHNMAAIDQLCRRSILLDSGTFRDMDDSNKIIRKYVSKNLNPKKRFYDNNPKDYNFYEVKIDNKKDQLIYNFDDNLTLQIKIKISNPIFGLTIGIAVKDEMKRKIFTSQYCLNEKDFENDILTKQMTIPANTLLSGRYYLDAACFIPNITTFSYLEDVIEYEIIDLESKVSMYSGSEIGSIFLDCKWE